MLKNAVTTCSGIVFDCNFAVSIEALAPCPESGAVVRNLRHSTDGPQPCGAMEQLLDETQANARDIDNEI